MMENQPVSQGFLLKEFIKKHKMPIGTTATALGMTRQNLNHHLRKDVLDADFARLIEKKLGIVYGDGKYSKTDLTKYSDRPDPPTPTAEQMANARPVSELYKIYPTLESIEIAQAQLEQYKMLLKKFNSLEEKDAELEQRIEKLEKEMFKR